MSVFVDKDGTVYERGKANEELKGTLPPTDVKKIKREQAKRKKERDKKKKERKAKEKKEIAKRNKHLTDSGYAKKRKRRKKKQ